VSNCSRLPDAICRMSVGQPAPVWSISVCRSASRSLSSKSNRPRRIGSWGAPRSRRVLARSYPPRYPRGGGRKSPAGSVGTLRRWIVTRESKRTASSSALTACGWRSIMIEDTGAYKETRHPRRNGRDAWQRSIMRIFLWIPRGCQLLPARARRSWRSSWIILPTGQMPAKSIASFPTCRWGRF